jgi:hypothetical protein
MLKVMKTIKLNLLVASLALLLGTTSCLDEMFVEGNGILRTEDRAATGFSQVASSGDFKVTVMPGINYSVEVTAESNLQSYIETDVVGSTLKIRTRGLYSLREHRDIEIFITTPVLNGVSISGSGMIKTGSFVSDDFRIAISGSGDIDTNVSADQIKANVSGSGTVFLTGDVFESEFVISGSGKIRAYDLIQDHCKGTISGSGDMYVNVSETLNASISGSGRIYYVNYPEVHTSISGSGKVIDKN